MKTLQISLTLIDEQYARLTAQHDQSRLISERPIALESIQTLIKKSKTDFYNADPNPIEVGKQLYFWLDGEARWLSQALDQTREGLVLAIETVERLAHLPWETLHDRAGFLVMRSNPIVIVRQVEGVVNQRELPERSLQVMFMATDPEAPGETKLEFEREESDILDATRRLPMVLRVEESGSIEGLKDIWQRYHGTLDVLHLSGHATIREVKGENGQITYQPYFVTETLTGDRDEATADAIAQVLRFREPRLVFLSGCRTGEAGGHGAAPSFAEQLVNQGVPAVLGWGRSVGDRVAIVAAAALYEKLATGYTLVQALALTYRAVSQNQGLSMRERSQWQLLRLYAVRSPEAWGAFVLTSGDHVVAPRLEFDDLFLGAEGGPRVASAAEFVGRRRNLQRCLRALKQQQGIVLHGLGGVGKSTVAKRLLERLVGYTPLVIYRDLTEVRLLDALLRQCESEIGVEILNGKLGLAQKLSKFFKQGLNEPNQRFAIVLDDFEANLEDRGDGLWVMTSEVVPVLQGLLEGMTLSKLPHRAIVTSRYDFGMGMRDNLHREPLAGLRDGDLKKKCDRLEAFQPGEIAPELRKKAIALSDGNPRLLEWLNLVLRDRETDQIKILAAMEGKRSEFRTQILAEELLRQQPEALVEMLGRGMVFEIPVPREVFGSVCEAEAQWIERAIALGLLEVVPDGSVRVPRILMVQGLAGEALAGDAARQLYRVWWEAARGTEEQVLEVHRLGLIGGEGTIAAEIADQVASRWKNQSRFREAVQLCRSTLEVAEDFRVRHQLARVEEPLGETSSALQNYQKALEDCPDVDDEDVLREKATIIHNMAIIYANQGQVESAIDLYQQSLQLFEQIGDVQGKAATLHCMANIYANQGQVESAIDLYQQSLQLEEQIGNVKGKAATLHCMAIIYANQGQVESAIDLYQQSLQIKEQIGDVQGKAATLHQMAGIYANQGQVERAIDLYQQSLQLQEQIGNVQGKAATLHQMAGIYANQGQVERAIDLYQQSLQIKEQIGDVQGKAATLHCMAIIYANQGQVESAIDLYQQSLQLQEQIGNVQGKAATLHCMAIIYANQGQVESAIDLYQQSLQLKEQIGNVQGKAATLHQMAGIYANQGQVESAIDLYQQSLQLFEQIGDVQGKAATLHQMAGIYANQGQVESAIDLYQQSLQLEEQIGNVQGKAATLHQMAGIYANQGQVESAIDLYQQSLQLQEQIGNVQGKAATLHCMAIIYANQGQVESAIDLYQQSLQLKEQIGNVQGKAATLHQMAGIYANQGQVESAIDLYQQSLQLEEQIGNVQGKAATLAMMSHLLIARGEFETAITNLRESINILQRIGSPDAATVINILNHAIELQNEEAQD